MRIYNRIGPNMGISYSLGGGLFFWFLVLLGAIPFLVIGVMFVAAVIGVAIALGILLIVNGIVFKALTGRDARVPVPGSVQGTAIEYWMEDKGWIRLPKRLQPLMRDTPHMSRRAERGSPQRKQNRGQFREM